MDGFSSLSDAPTLQFQPAYPCLKSIFRDSLVASTKSSGTRWPVLKNDTGREDDAICWQRTA